MILPRHDWTLGIFLVSAAIVAGNGIHYLLFRLLRKDQVGVRRRSLGLHKHLGGPARAVFLTIGLLIVLPMLPRIPAQARDRIEQLAQCLLVLFIGWLAVGGVAVFKAFMLSRFDTTVPNNLRARRVHTQVQFVCRILLSLVILLDAGALLWNFHDQRLWKFGTGLLASAGLASVVLALAAKSTASNFIAGLQIALNEPIRIDDVVIIQGEWGRIEEITSTNVIVKIWDERRMIVPLTFFIEQPFQNWTRRSSDMMGTAFLYLDYSVPIEPLRAELERIVRSSSLWDGRVCGLQVTNLTDRVMEVRCLMSSIGSGENFDLRCLVREKMVEFLRSNYPDALPTFRVRLSCTDEKPPQSPVPSGY